MSKSKKRRKNGPTLPPIVTLRPRLDQLFSDVSFLEQEMSAGKTQIDHLLKEITPQDFWPVLLKAYQAASEQVQQSLAAMLPQWIRERGDQDTLIELVDLGRFDEKGQQNILQWLQAAGTDITDLQQKEETDRFFEAYTFSDDSQGFILLFWYEDRRRRKVEGVNFLLDYNPPWEGAVKDAMFIPAGQPERVVQTHLGFWRQRGVPLISLNAIQAKEHILQHLLSNRRAKIRLPRDLIISRKTFLENVLILPDGARTPRFTKQDFDELSQTGKSPEAIRRYEQTVGRMVRLPDGKEALIDANLVENDPL
ncbi:predicted extracellular nuclease [Candidatus Vecturithrix granuli]|uniref:Predicted extracellular nuclease n=1 Tax=Vecturithrix granuli TaxID=1499967 RepID=A0A081C9D1_VECG1|nr:predicted extracellular nuclease [Candidatus Vecturithrix granuli]